MPALLNMFHFMKQNGNWAMDEMYSLHPWEFELYYYMLVNDIKAKHEAEKKQRSQSQGRNIH